MAAHTADARTSKPRSTRRAGVVVFAHFGIALALLRDLRGRSQAEVARAAGIGKSQLSKYEGGRELPKLESLARILLALEATHLEFAYTLALVQQRAERVASRTPSADDEAASLLLAGCGLAPAPLDGAMHQLVEDLSMLYRRILETILFGVQP